MERFALDIEMGRRVRGTAPDGSVTRYVYDSDDMAWEMDGAGNILREYTYYPGVDQPYAVRVGGYSGQEYYYSTDHIGNVLGLVRADGTLANAYTYGPWGETLTANEAATQPLRFAARELDPVTGMYYVRARWYDPQQGRFVSEDPIGLEGGINLYSYAANSPTNMTDPSGLCPKNSRSLPTRTKMERSTRSTVITEDSWSGWHPCVLYRRVRGGR